ADVANARSRLARCQHPGEMPLSDLLRAAPGVLLVVGLPGWAIAALVVPRWRWWEQLATVPVLGCGAIGLLGFAYHDVGLGVRAVAAAAGWRRRRSAAAPPGAATSSGDPVRWIAVAALGAGILSAATAAAAYRGTVLPTETDAPVHGAVAAAIVRTGDAVPIL